MVSAGRPSNIGLDQTAAYLGLLDLTTETFTDYSNLVDSRIVDLDFEPDGSVLFFVELEEADYTIKVSRFSFLTEEKTEWINSTFF